MAESYFLNFAMTLLDFTSNVMVSSGAGEMLVDNKFVFRPIWGVTTAFTLSRSTSSNCIALKLFAKSFL